MTNFSSGAVRNITQELASFAQSVSYCDLPKQVIHETKRLILDTIGCGLAGYKTDIGRISLQLAKAMGGRPESTIIGEGHKSSCFNAAYANAKISNALDLEGTGVGGHLAPTCLYSGLAAAERRKATGKDLITAVAVGYDVTVRIASSWRPGELVYQKANVSGIGTPIFGAVTSVAKILKLDQQQMLQAFGIAGAYAPISSLRKWPVQPGPMLKYVDPGWMALGGTMSAFLAKIGHTGYTTILDGDTGFWRMSDPEGTYIPGVITRQLGKKWGIQDYIYKYFPCCHWMQTALHLLSELIEEEKIMPEEIEQITVTSSPNMVLLNSSLNCDPCEPKNLVGSQFSVPYNVALVVLGIKPGQDWSNYEALTSNPKVQKICHKVKLVVEPTYSWPYEKGWKAARVEIIARKQRFSKFTEYLKGDPSRPETYMTDKELKTKFTNILEQIVPTDQIRKLIQTVDVLEEIEDITSLTRLMCVHNK